MPSLLATLRASSTAESEQQPLSWAKGRSSGQSCMVTPMHSYPCSTSSAAATELSTPPLIATKTRPFLLACGTADSSSLKARAYAGVAQPFDEGREDFEDPVNLLDSIPLAQRKPDRAQGCFPIEAHRQEDVRRLDRA